MKIQMTTVSSMALTLNGSVFAVLLHFSQDCCTNFFQVEAGPQKAARVPGLEHGRHGSSYCQEYNISSQLDTQGQSCVHALPHPCHLSQVTQQNSHAVWSSRTNGKLHLPHPATVVVKVPPIRDESIRLVLDCDSVSTVSIGRELLATTPVIPLFVLDFTFVCLVVP